MFIFNNIYVNLLMNKYINIERKFFYTRQLEICKKDYIFHLNLLIIILVF